MTDEPLQMRIGELSKQRDVGVKKRSRIGPEAMDYLKTTLVCRDFWYKQDISGSMARHQHSSSEKHMEVIRIDGQLRKNLGVSLNDTVMHNRQASSKTGKLDDTSSSYRCSNRRQRVYRFCKKPRRRKACRSHKEMKYPLRILVNSMPFQIAKCIPKAIVKIDLRNCITHTRRCRTKVCRYVPQLQDLKTILGGGGESPQSPSLLLFCQSDLQSLHT